MNKVLVEPPVRWDPVDIQLPLSKSISNRLQVINYLAGSESLTKMPDSDDSIIMQRLLKQLTNNSSYIFDAGDAGTAFRFFCALAAVTEGKRIITGSNRMKQRPCGPLIDALHNLGVSCTYLENVGFPPVMIEGMKIKGGTVEIDSSISSQFISALMMVAPLMINGLTLKLKGKVVSEPYINITAYLMRRCGINLESGNSIISIEPGIYQLKDELNEGDWSAASYWFAYAALISRIYGFKPGHELIVLKGLDQKSLQGDSVVVELFSKLGVESCKNAEGHLVLITGQVSSDRIEYDLSPFPDLAPSLAVVCAGLNLNAVLYGLSTLKIKETDRLFAISNELKKLDFNCSFHDTGELIINRNSRSDAINRKSGTALLVSPASVETYNDHRMAMSFSLLSLLCGPLYIINPQVVSKSYPLYWKHLIKAGFNLHYS